MARGNGEGSIAKRPDGSWCARITIGYDEHGKQLRRAFYGRTRKEVVAKMNAAQQELNRMKGRDFNSITVADWADYWLDEYKKRNVRIATYHTMQSAFRLHINPAVGSIKLVDLKSEMVQKMVNDMADEEYSLSVIKKNVIHLHDSLNQAVKNGLVRKNVATNMRYPQQARKGARAMTQDEQTKFIAVAKERPLGDLFILMLATGLRIGEATALTWADIDFDKGYLHVNKTYTNYYDCTKKAKIYTLSTPKTEAGIRYVPILPAVLDMLKKRLPEKHKPTDHVFRNINPNGDHLNVKTGSAEHYLKKILKEAGIDGGVHLHTLRHTFATRGLENGIELKVMQELLGHANIAITADTYTHVLPDTKKDAMMKMADTVAMPDEPEQVDQEEKRD